MNTHSANQVNAIRTTIQYCTDNTSATSGITAFAGVLTTAKNKLILIDNYDLIATGTTKGVTIDTKAVRAVMESIAFKCSNAVIAFASQVPVNNTLIALVKYTKTQLSDAKKEDIAAICEKIRKAANDNAGSLNFGITASDITDLASAIALYNLASANPRQAKINKNDAIKQIKILIKSVNQDIFKNQMDRMVLTLESTNAIFVGKYFKAREIIDLGKTHTKVKGNVKKTDGTAIPFPTLKLMKTGTTVVDYLIKGNATGIIPNTYVKPDDYNMLVECPTYISQTEISIHFAPGKTIKRNYVLLPV